MLASVNHTFYENSNLTDNSLINMQHTDLYYANPEEFNIPDIVFLDKNNNSSDTKSTNSIAVKFTSDIKEGMNLLVQRWGGSCLISPDKCLAHLLKSRGFPSKSIQAYEVLSLR